MAECADISAQKREEEEEDAECEHSFADSLERRSASSAARGCDIGVE